MMKVAKSVLPFEEDLFAAIRRLSLPSGHVLKTWIVDD